MNCYRPRYIRNSVLPENRTGFDKSYIKVSCGQCPACRKRRSNDWFFRSYWEYVLGDYKSAFFVSLDFDNEHLPTYHCKPCFDSELMKSFLKRLRSKVPQFRMLYTSEYGGFLRRPHYHMIALFRDSISKDFFFSQIRDAWTYGSHEDVTQLDSVGDSIIKAIQYVTDYVTKDVTFDLDIYERDFPKRYSSCIHPSVNWGLSALEECKITYEDIRDRKPISLPIGKNGKLVDFDIPRYYEQKLFYDTTFYSSLLRTVWKKNEDGINASIFRHNGRYVYFIKQFFASRNCNPGSLVRDRFKKLFPKSPYCIMPYRDIVLDAMSDFHHFKDFVWNRDFFKRLTPTKDFEDLIFKLDIKLDGSCYNEFYNTFIEIPGMRRFHEACVFFEFYQLSLANSSDIVESYELQEAAKKRAYSKIFHDPKKARYLAAKNFDFTSLKSTSFSDAIGSIDISVHRSGSKLSIYQRLLRSNPFVLPPFLGRDNWFNRYQYNMLCKDITRKRRKFYGYPSLAEQHEFAQDISFECGYDDRDYYIYSTVPF